MSHVKRSVCAGDSVNTYFSFTKIMQHIKGKTIKNMFSTKNNKTCVLAINLTLSCQIKMLVTVMTFWVSGQLFLVRRNLAIVYKTFNLPTYW